MRFAGKRIFTEDAQSELDGNFEIVVANFRVEGVTFKARVASCWWGLVEQARSTKTEQSSVASVVRVPRTQATKKVKDTTTAKRAATAKTAAAKHATAVHRGPSPAPTFAPDGLYFVGPYYDARHGIPEHTPAMGWHP